MISLIRERVHQTVRRLTRAPTFAIPAAITLALGIGATTTVFTVVNGVLLRPLPFERADELVDLSHTLAVSGISRVDQSDATYLVYRAENRSFTDVGAYRAGSANVQASGATGENGAGQARRVATALATASTFHVLHSTALRGRLFRDEDGAPGAAPVAIVSQGFWEQELGADPDVVGRRVLLDGVAHEVVGVMPARFHFPLAETSLWIPLVLDPVHINSAAFDFRAIARLRHGVSIASATADLQRLLPNVPERYPGRLTGAAIKAIKMQAVVRPQRDVVVGDVGRVLWIVFGAVAVLLVVACANVGNLFVARAEGRQRDLAVRQALGASRSALLTDFLAEGVLLSAAGAALGTGLAIAGVRSLLAMGGGTSIPRLDEVSIDGWVLAVTAGAAAVAALTVSAVPVLRTSAVSLSSVLLANGPTTHGGRSRSRARRALVIVQMSLALVLLAAAGLCARSFNGLRAVRPGFVSDSVLTFRVSLPAVPYPDAASIQRLINRSVETISTLPGVQVAGVVSKLPLDVEARQDSAVYVEDHPVPAGGIPDIHQIVFATPGYFQAMGIPLVDGRLLQPIDPSAEAASLPREVLVSEAFAQRYWKAHSPVGKRIRMSPATPWSTIVGVVGSVHDEGLDVAGAEQVYAPLVTLTTAGTPWAPRNLAFAVRVRGNVPPSTSMVRDAIATIDPALAVYRIRPISALLAGATARITVTMLMLSIAGFVALVIGATGTYGVVSYLVQLRTREIGVRVALGAGPRDVRRLVVHSALVDVVLGVAAGLAGATAVTRALKAILYDVSPLDPISLGVASLMLVLAALAASWIPARRAIALDPLTALRLD